MQTLHCVLTKVTIGNPTLKLTPVSDCPSSRLVELKRSLPPLPLPPIDGLPDAKNIVKSLFIHILLI